MRFRGQKIPLKQIQYKYPFVRKAYAAAHIIIPGIREKVVDAFIDGVGETSSNKPWLLKADPELTKKYCHLSSKPH